MIDTASVLPSLRRLIETERQRFDVPGCAVAVVQGGQVLLAEGFGYRDLDARLPVTGQTLFAIGSSTKTFTAALCTTLAHEGVLDLDVPVRTLLPGFEMHDPVATQFLSLRDCLGHRSGLPRHDLLWYAGDGLLTREEVIHSLRHLPPTRSFRETWQYNNLLYLTAGHIAGVQAGGGFEQALSDRILAPLKMRRTCFGITPAQQGEDVASPYASDGQGSPRAIDRTSLDLAGPAGNINSSAQEMARWALTLLGQGVEGNPPLIDEAVLTQLRTPVVPLSHSFLPGPAQPLGYGLGLFVEDYRGKRSVHHGGNIDGFACQVYLVPQDEVGIVVLANLDMTALRDALPYLILDLLDDLQGSEHGAAFYTAMTAVAGETDHEARPTKPGNRPVRPLTDYVGDYRHEGYGTIGVEGSAEGLRARYLGLDPMPLQHKQLEVFDLQVVRSGTTSTIACQFTHDLDGEVSALLVKFEPELPPLPFARQPRPLPETVVARRCGTYERGPITAVVSRRGPNLTVSVGRRPRLDLVPIRDDLFSAGGSRFEFTEDVLRTPYGEFRRVSAP